MKPNNAIALAVVSLSFIGDHHVTHYIASLGDGYGPLSSLLAGFSYLNLTFAVLFGLIAPCILRRAVANPLQVSIRKNEITINGVQYDAEFSSDTDLVAVPLALHQALHNAITERLSGSRVALRPAAVVTAQSPENRCLSTFENDLLQDVLNEHFLHATLEDGRSSSSRQGAQPMTFCQ